MNAKDITNSQNLPAPESLIEAVKVFSDLDVALRFMVALRWPNGVTCPHCGSQRVRFIGTRRVWECREDHHVLVEGKHIREVSDRLLTSTAATTIDLDGRTLMPGLIDAHVHVLAVDAALARLADRPVTLLTLQAAQVLEGMLARGFTTIRDAGGAAGSEAGSAIAATPPSGGSRSRSAGAAGPKWTRREPTVDAGAG